ncbi:MAG: helix-turn-helix domain-containing protein [Planctomycetota bacterium]
MARRISRRSVIARLLDDSPSPVFVLHADRRVAYANAALGRWLGLDPDKMPGLECTYSSESVSPVAGLCPPPEVFAGTAIRGSVWRVTPQGDTERRTAEFIPLAASDDQPFQVLVVVGTDQPAEVAPAQPAPEIQSQALHAQLWQLRAELARDYHTEQLIVVTPAMLRVRQLVAAAAGSRDHVVIYGAAGTGREHVARTIHQAAEATPLATVLAKTLDEELLQSTIAELLRRCAELDGNPAPTVLLLDGESLSPEVQQALATLLEADQLAIRWVTTTRGPLTALARQGGFDERLAFGLSGIEIELPGLDHRLEDIPLLVQRFVELWNRDASHQFEGVTEEAMAHFLVYPWSEHLREMKQLVWEACEQATGAWIDVDSLPFPLRAAIDATIYAKPPALELPLDERLREVEIEAIRQALTTSKGNRAQAARILGINRARLLRRIEHLEIDDPHKPEGRGGPG